MIISDTFSPIVGNEYMVKIITLETGVPKRLFEETVKNG